MALLETERKEGGEEKEGITEKKRNKTKRD